MAEKEIVETSEAEIAVHWGEEEYYHPSTQFVAQANLTDSGIFERFSLTTSRIALKNTPIFWTGMNTGTKSWIPAMHPAGNGLRAAK